GDADVGRSSDRWREVRPWRVGSSEERHGYSGRYDPERHHHLSVALRTERQLSINPDVHRKRFSRVAGRLAECRCDEGVDSVQQSECWSKVAWVYVHDVGREEGCAA